MPNNKSETDLKSLKVCHEKAQTAFKSLEKTFRKELQLYDYLDVKVKEGWKIGQVVQKGDLLAEINYDGYPYSLNEVL